MKKLLYLLFLIPFAFASCSSSDDENDDTVYIDNKLIEGAWYRIQASDSIVYTFEDDIVTKEMLEKFTQYSIQKTNFGGYRLTPDYIKYLRGGTLQKYKLDKDTLYIWLNDEFIKHIRVK